MREPSGDPARSENLCMCGIFMRENREIPRLPSHRERCGPLGEGLGRTPEMYGRGKSDCLIVPAKPSNKALCGCGDGGGKGAARGERGQHNTLRTQSRVRCVKCAGPCASVRA